jgi:hypothetical protein
VADVRVHYVTDAEQLAAFGQWYLGGGRLAIALWPGHHRIDYPLSATWAFARLGHVWVIPWESLIGDFLHEGLQTALKGIVQHPATPEWVSRHADADIQQMTALGLTEEQAQTWGAQCRGSLWEYGEAVGETMRPRDASWHPAFDAYDVFGRFTQEGAKSVYYDKVTLPLSIYHGYRAMPVVNPEEPGEWRRWKIRYPDLTLRMIAHYSQEPLLMTYFREQSDAALRGDMDIYDRLAQDLSMTPDEVMPTLIGCLERYDNFIRLAPHLNKALPMVSYWIQQNRLAATSEFKTIYGTVVRLDDNDEDPKHARFRNVIQASCEQILNVSAVSLVNYGETHHFTFEELGDGIIVGYNERAKVKRIREFLRDVSWLAKLGNPLSLPLAPQVTVD